MKRIPALTSAVVAGALMVGALLRPESTVWLSVALTCLCVTLVTCRRRQRAIPRPFLWATLVAMGVSLVAPSCLCINLWDTIEGSLVFATVFNGLIFTLAGAGLWLRGKLRGSKPTP